MVKCSILSYVEHSGIDNRCFITVTYDELSLQAPERDVHDAIAIIQRRTSAQTLTYCRGGGGGLPRRIAYT